MYFVLACKTNTETFERNILLERLCSPVMRLNRIKLSGCVEHFTATPAALYFLSAQQSVLALECLSTLGRIESTSE